MQPPNDPHPAGAGNARPPDARRRNPGPVEVDGGLATDVAAFLAGD